MKKFFIIGVMAVLGLSACSGGLPHGGETPEKAVAIAQCLEENDAKMYGAFWCPHCNDQKRNFGSEAEKYMPYNECDPNGEDSVTDTCLELEVERYPTWIFADGRRVEGEQTLADLQRLSGCTDAELEQYMEVEEAMESVS